MLLSRCLVLVCCISDSMPVSLTSQAKTSHLLKELLLLYTDVREVSFYIKKKKH